MPGRAPMPTTSFSSGNDLIVSGKPFRLGVLRSINDIAAADWDRCAGPENPFVSHAFLKALEDSGCTSAETGWLPQHAILQDDGGSVLAVAPCYLKGHSQGEYVFDHGWAQAFERAGGRYYPKLLVAAPFSPVPGPRLLVGGDNLAPSLVRERSMALAQGLAQMAQQSGVSSLHVNFCRPEEWEILASTGFLKRTGEQFHWTNDDYADFEAFLAALASRKRKMIRKERRDAVANGVSIVRLTGDDLTEEHWDAFFRFYMDTGNRKWGQPYLNRDFFALLHETMRHKVLLVMARRAGRWIAGALNLIGRDTLYGRNWGCIEYHPGLHFECCYYQAIEWAIANRLKRVEAGAQGEHKLARGYLPCPTYSAHWIGHPGFRRAVAEYLEAERRQVDNAIAYLSEHSPFRQIPEHERVRLDELDEER